MHPYVLDEADTILNRASDIETLGKNYLQKAYPAYTQTYNKILGSATVPDSLLTSGAPGNTGPVNGGWLGWKPTSAFSDAILDDFSKSLGYKMVK